MRVVIELKRGEVGEVILNNLYKHTQLQQTFGIIMLAIVAGRPRVLTLLDVIERVRRSSAARWCAGGSSSSCARRRRARTSSKACGSRSTTSTR